METKVCVRCGTERPVADFPLRTVGGTRRGTCAPCRNDDRTKCNERHPERLAAERKRRDPVKRAAQWKRWAARTPSYVPFAKWNREHKAIKAEIGRAHWAVRKAIRNGELTRPSQCEACGKTARIEAAHEDYSRPLDVRWLCHSCHVRWDNKEPKTIGLPVLAGG